MKKLEDKIWETRKTRINTEKRLKNYALFSEISIPWITAHLIILNFFDIDNIKIISVIGSLLVLIFSIILTSQNYRVRARELKTHYIFLEKLIQRISNGEDEQNIYDEYLNELDKVENQSTTDYIRVVIECRKSPDKTLRNPRFTDWGRVIVTDVISFLAIASIAILPIFLEILALKKC